MSTLRNKVNLIGRVGQKPEMQTLKGGYSLTKFSLATKEPYKDKSGEWKDRTQWHQVILWGRSAERFVKTIGKGAEIALEGRLLNRQYETSTGEKRYSTEIEAHEFLLLTKTIQAHK